MQSINQYRIQVQYENETPGREIPVHDPQHLKREHVLSEVVSYLQYNADVGAGGVCVLELQLQRPHLAVHHSTFIRPVGCRDGRVRERR